MTFSDLKYYTRLINDMKEKKKWYKGKIFQSENTKGMSIPYKIKIRLNYLIYDIRSAWQRAKNGYAHSDVWSIDDWFSNTIIHMLSDLIENHSAYPGYGDADTPDKWEEILRYMKFCFQESREDTCSQQNEIKIPVCDILVNDDNSVTFSTTPEFDQWSKRDKELAEYRKKMLYEGLDLFKKYYYDLWD